VLGYGLPDRLPRDADVDALVALMHRDKKATSGLTFVLDSPRGLEVVPDVDVGQVRLALEAIK
jgi:5-deoxy-5-amino-3-dehydroquinate synthase